MNQDTLYFDCAGLLEFMHLHHENTELYLVHCGMQQCAPGHSYGHKARPEYHLHFILDGQGTVNIHSKEYHLSRGDIFVIPPEVEDYVYQADPENPWYYAWISFHGTKAEFFLKQAGFHNKKIVRASNIPPEEFTTLIYDMLKASQLTLANELKRVALLHLILAKLIESHTPTLSPARYDYSSDLYVKHALHYIEFHYNRDIQVHDIAEYIGLNRSYFSQIFKEKMKLSPREYLQTYRVQQACILLENTNHSVAEIAQQVGYNDPFTFSKLFKRLTGTCPTQYRQEQLAKES
jgi:AraC family transcriptional regulator of arabinose operon